MQGAETDSSFDPCEAEIEDIQERMLAEGFLKPLVHSTSTSSQSVESGQTQRRRAPQAAAGENPHNVSSPEYLSVAEAAKVAGLSEKAIRRAITDGELMAAKVRSRIRIRRPDLHAWFDDSRIEASVHDIEPWR
jgi:excisionase family DNA binding protein